ncbi:major facilitator superfamily MFS_1 [Actinobacteria bacterium OK074]|nr:major facilitator superfamily MFS_1 [Actinobacteria bacterium OK074]
MLLSVFVGRGRHRAPRRPATGIVRDVYLPRTADALAVSMATYAIPLLVLDTTHSPALTGLAFALEWVPRLSAFGLAGTLVDRFGPAVVFRAAATVRSAVVVLAAVALAVAPAGQWSTVIVMLCAAVTGMVTEFSYVAGETSGAHASRLAGAQAHRVQSVLLGIDQGGTLLGPAAGGVLLLAGASRLLLAIGALSLTAALLMPHRRAQATANTELARSAAPAGAAGLRTGWNTLRTLPALGVLVAGLTVSNLVVGLLQATTPVTVVTVFGRSGADTGLLWSAAAAASLAAITLCRTAIDRWGLWTVGAVCSAVASLSCLAIAHATSYPLYVLLIGMVMAGEGGMTVVLRTVRTRLIPAPAFASTLAATILILLLPFPCAGLLVALTPPTALPHLITGGALLQALAMSIAFARLRHHPVLRAPTALTQPPAPAPAPAPVSSLGVPPCPPPPPDSPPPSPSAFPRLLLSFWLSLPAT